jgi:hypothetical protein
MPSPCAVSCCLIDVFSCTGGRRFCRGRRLQYPAAVGSGFATSHAYGSMAPSAASVQGAQTCSVARRHIFFTGIAPPYGGEGTIVKLHPRDPHTILVHRLYSCRVQATPSTLHLPTHFSRSEIHPLHKLKQRPRCMCFLLSLGFHANNFVTTLFPGEEGPTDTAGGVQCTVHPAQPGHLG